MNGASLMGGLSGDKRLKVDGGVRKTHWEGMGRSRRGLLAAFGGEGGFGLVLLTASVGRALSPSASVVVLPKSDFLAYSC